MGAANGKSSTKKQDKPGQKELFTYIETNYDSTCYKRPCKWHFKERCWDVWEELKDTETGFLNKARVEERIFDFTPQPPVYIHGKNWASMILGAFDSNGDGVIDMFEFATIYAFAWGHFKTEDRLKGLFTVLDQDKSGIIDLIELATLIEVCVLIAMANIEWKETGKLIGLNYEGMVLTNEQRIRLQEVIVPGIMKVIDTSNTGKFSYDQLASGLNDYPTIQAKYECRLLQLGRSYLELK